MFKLLYFNSIRKFQPIGSKLSFHNSKINSTITFDIMKECSTLAEKIQNNYLTDLIKLDNKYQPQKARIDIILNIFINFEKYSKELRNDLDRSYFLQSFSNTSAYNNIFSQYDELTICAENDDKFKESITFKNITSLINSLNTNTPPVDYSKTSINN